MSLRYIMTSPNDVIIAMPTITGNRVPLRQLHGGSWRGYHPEQRTSMVRLGFASTDWSCFRIYRLAWKGHHLTLCECAREYPSIWMAVAGERWMACMARELRCKCFCIDVSMGLRGVMALRAHWSVLMEWMDGLSFGSAVVIDDVKIVTWRAQRSGLPSYTYVWRGGLSFVHVSTRASAAVTAFIEYPVARESVSRTLCSLEVCAEAALVYDRHDMDTCSRNWNRSGR